MRRLFAAWSGVAGSALQRLSMKLGSKSAEMTAQMKFTVQVAHDELDGGFVAECLELPGCVSQGETEKEALDNIVDAITEVVEIRMQDSLKSAEFSIDHGRSTHTHQISVA